MVERRGWVRIAALGATTARLKAAATKAGGQARCVSISWTVTVLFLSRG